MQLIIATKNMHKVTEFKRILEPLGYTVLSQADVDLDIDVEETGTTFAENAKLKAFAIYKATGKTTIADDSGLEVFSLNNEPGVYSARYGGSGLDDTGRNMLLLKNLDGVPKKDRGARFVAAIHIIFGVDDEKTFIGTSEGYISTEIVGDNGFGYDPVFMVNETESFATISGEEKDKISHRGNALKALEKYLKEERENNDN